VWTQSELLVDEMRESTLEKGMDLEDECPIVSDIQ